MKNVMHSLCGAITVSDSTENAIFLQYEALAVIWLHALHIRARLEFSRIISDVSLDVLPRPLTRQMSTCVSGVFCFHVSLHFPLKLHGYGILLPTPKPDAAINTTFLLNSSPREAIYWLMPYLSTRINMSRIDGVY